MLELPLFKRAGFTGAQIVAFCLSASIFAMFLYLTLYLQNDLGFTPLEAGLRFLPVSLLSFLVAAPSGKLASHIPPRLLMGAGLLLVSIGLWLMHGVDDAAGWATLLPGFIVAGLGVGLTNPALASTAISVVRRERSGVASGINSTVRQVGIATGIAGLGAALQNQIEARFLDTPSGSHVPTRALDGVVQGISAGRIGDVANAAPPQSRAQIAHDASA